MRLLLPLLLVLSVCTRGRAQVLVSAEEQDPALAFILNLSLPIVATYDVQNIKILYNTTDVFGQPTVASGLLCVPANPNNVYPMAVYNHGTVSDREQVPSREGVLERLLPQGIASQGYITVAPDYLGLGDNPGIHPYVHADSEASAGRDLLLAAKEWLAANNRRQNGQLFLTGYSQGGHATAALHRELVQNPTPGLEVTSATYLSGPYSIADVMRTTIFEDELVTLPGYIAYTYASYDYVYGLYDSLGQVFVPPYVTLTDSFVNQTIQLGEYDSLLTARLMENDHILADIFQDSIRQQLADNDPNDPIIRALRDNDTYDWAPDEPTLIYYCTADLQVPPRNAILADSVMRANGAPAITLTNGGPLDHGGCVIPASVATLDFWRDLVNIFPTSTLTVQQETPFVLAPNPVKVGEEMRFLTPDGEAVHYRLYDMTGREVLRGVSGLGSGVRVPAELTAGTFVLKAELASGESVVRRIIVR